MRERVRDIYRESVRERDRERERERERDGSELGCNGPYIILTLKRGLTRRKDKVK